MSQVASRTPSVMSEGRASLSKLPKIAHPLSRMTTPASQLDVRGTSRASSKSLNKHLPLPGIHPLASSAEQPFRCEEEPVQSRRSYRSSANEVKAAQSMPEPLVKMDNIPEQVEIVQGDPNKAQLPIFGNRAEIPPSRGSVTCRADVPPTRGSVASRAESRLSQIANERLEIDELEVTLREKMKSSYYELRKRFNDNDPEQKGNVTRDALLRILVSSLSRPVTMGQLTRLLERLELRGDKVIISFNEFQTALRPPPEKTEKNYPIWMDPVQRQEKTKMSAEQVHVHLKAKMRRRFLNLADVIPQFIEGGAGRIMEAEFKNFLNKNHFFMDEEEFQKLWKRYDPLNSGVVNGVTMLKEMGIVMQGSAKKALPPIQEEDQETDHQAKKAKLDRENSNKIENWLTKKFREAFYSMREAFEAEDTSNRGLVDHEVFLKILAKFGLSLEKKNLVEFLSRCAIVARKDGVAYQEFLLRFQDRSEAGMAHKILSNPYYERETKNKEEDKTKMFLSALECQIMNMFQKDFLSLLATFQKIDKYELGTISQEEFRHVLESQLSLTFTSDQFKGFIENVPLNPDGLVKYDDFMKQFDTRCAQTTLFEDKTKKKVTSQEVASEMTADEADRMDLDQKGSVSERPKRSLQETKAEVKRIFDTRFQEMEREFQEIDHYNSDRLTQEQMYQLMKRMNIEPEISRGEIRELWKIFILNDRHSLEYPEFVRHFIYDPATATFPNAKVEPPKKGDSDFMMKSRTLNGTTMMLEETLRSKIDFLWEQLRQEFVEMDPFGTGFITKEEFQEVLKELCIQLSDYEMGQVTQKFDLRRDGRISYYEFLKPFAMKHQLSRHGNNMLSLLQHSDAEIFTQRPRLVPGGLSFLTAKLGLKLGHNDWKTLQRAFKKLDSDNTGYLSLPEFRTVLKMANVLLDEEEVFQLMSHFDSNMSGHIPYQRFLDETVKPTTQHTRRATPRPLKG